MNAAESRVDEAASMVAIDLHGSSATCDQLAYVREWGGKFIVPIPEVQVCA
jgi:hypothetical protein